MKKLLPALILLSLIASSPVLGQEEGDGDSDAPEITLTDKQKQELLDLFPDADKLGVTPVEQPEFFSESNLFEYINGGADAYHSYDFVSLIHQDFDKGKTTVTVDIYNMGESLNAFGIYSAERSPRYRFVSLGAQGYESKDCIYFLQDSYYIQLVAYSRDRKPTDKLLQAFAKAISAQIKKGKELPKIVTCLPQKNLVANTETYLKKAPIGHAFLAPALTAKYVIQDVTCTLLLSQAKSTQDAEARIQHLKEHLKKVGKAADLPDLHPRAFRGSSKYEGELVAFPHGRHAILLLEPPESPEPFLKGLIDTIPKDL